jgi:hypothetical protein
MLPGSTSQWQGDAVDYKHLAWLAAAVAALALPCLAAPGMAVPAGEVPASASSPQGAAAAAKNDVKAATDVAPPAPAGPAAHAEAAL